MVARRSGRRDAASLREAIGEVYGVESTGTKVEAAGRTDVEITRAILLQLGVSARRIDDGLADLRVAASEAYARRVPADLSSTVLPGMTDLLEELAPRDDVLLSLVTGNLQPIARLKLAAAGIGRFFPGGQGGFGSDSEDRTRLPAVARARAGTATPRTRASGRSSSATRRATSPAPARTACARWPWRPGPTRHELGEADAVAADAHALRGLIAALLV